MDREEAFLSCKWVWTMEKMHLSVSRGKDAEDAGDLEGSGERHSFGEEICMFVKREGK